MWCDRAWNLATGRTDMGQFSVVGSKKVECIPQVLLASNELETDLLYFVYLLV